MSDRLREWERKLSWLRRVAKAAVDEGLRDDGFRTYVRTKGKVLKLPVSVLRVAKALRAVWDADMFDCWEERSIRRYVQRWLGISLEDCFRIMHALDRGPYEGGRVGPTQLPRRSQGLVDVLIACAAEPVFDEFLADEAGFGAYTPEPVFRAAEALNALREQVGVGRWEPWRHSHVIMLSKRHCNTLLRRFRRPGRVAPARLPQPLSKLVAVVEDCAEQRPFRVFVRSGCGYGFFPGYGPEPVIRAVATLHSLREQVGAEYWEGWRRTHLSVLTRSDCEQLLQIPRPMRLMPVAPR
jgi:hypothetical protein